MYNYMLYIHIYVCVCPIYTYTYIYIYARIPEKGWNESQRLLFDSRGGA